MKHVHKILLLVGALLIGCSKITAPPEPQPQGIYGNWRWTQSVGGFAGTTITPATAGYTMRIVLRTDNFSEFYKNDTLQTITRFIIRRKKSLFSPDSVDVIHYEDTTRFISQIISVVNSDTLALVDLCFDCYGHIYVR